LLGWRLAWVGPLWVVRQRYLVLVRDLTGPLPAAPARPDVRWTRLAEPDVPRLHATDPGLGLVEIRRRLAEGQECHLWWLGDSIVHYRWEATRSAYLPYLGLTLRLLPGDVCSTWSFTHPAFRRRGLLAATSPAQLHRIRAGGARRSIAIVAWWHTASLRVTRDGAGRTIVGAVGCWQLGPWRRHVAEGAVRFDGPGVFHVARDSPEPADSREPGGTGHAVRRL
jgi:hypothetical protein